MKLNCEQCQGNFPEKELWGGYKTIGKEQIGYQVFCENCLIILIRERKVEGICFLRLDSGKTIQRR